MKGKLISGIKRTSEFWIDLFADGRIKAGAMRALPFWIASVITGLVAVGYTKLFLFSEQCLHNILHWHKWIVFLLTPVFFFLAWTTVRLFAPNAKGSGIPQVMAAIELSSTKHQQKIKRFLSVRILAIKICSSLLMISGGGAIGREGPTIQIAGSIFRAVYSRIPSSWPRLSRQSFILTGAAAGLAAAFNTPLGGIVFAMEELAKIHIRFFRTPLFSAVIIAGLTAQGILGPYLYLGYPDVRNLKFSLFFGVAITAIAAGIAGSLMAKMILRLVKWKQSLTLAKTTMYVLFSGLVIATIAYFINDEILGSGKDLMNSVLFTDNKDVSWHTAIMRVIGPAISFNTGAAGGIFAPSLAAGASVGSYIASLFHLAGGNANILILGGMVGFLTGVTRTPFTSAILVLEMTDRHGVIFHLMLAALVSNMAALLVSKHSLYEELKKSYINETIHSRPD